MLNCRSVHCTETRIKRLRAYERQGVKMCVSSSRPSWHTHEATTTSHTCIKACNWLRYFANTNIWLVLMSRDPMWSLWLTKRQTEEVLLVFLSFALAYTPYSTVLFTNNNYDKSTPTGKGGGQITGTLGSGRGPRSRLCCTYFCLPRQCHFLYKLYKLTPPHQAKFILHLTVTLSDLVQRFFGCPPLMRGPKNSFHRGPNPLSTNQ